MSTERLPANLEAERCVLGAVLLRNDLLDVAADVLDVDDFYSEKHQAIYRAMLNLRIADSPIDAGSVGDALGDDLERAGGLGGISALIDGLPRVDARFVLHHGGEIGGKAGLRRLVESANALATAGMNGSDEIDERIADLGAALAARQHPGAEAEFEVDEGRYRLTMPGGGVVLEADFLRRESHHLKGELMVRCTLPGVRTFDGVLSGGDFNFSSARTRQSHAKHLAERGGTGVDWAALVEEFAQRILAVERAGQPAVLLHELPRPEAETTLEVNGLALLARHPAILFGDGGAVKSYLALYFAGVLAQRGLAVGYFDWELAGDEHRERLERLFGADSMPPIHYARCARPLVYELDRLRGIVRDNALDYAVFDSVAFACDGPPEAAEVAGRYFQALRALGPIGSLHAAHVTKATEHADRRPFGSTFWHNGARATWNVKLAEALPGDHLITVGLYNRKANLGAIRPAIGFEFTFAPNCTRVRRVDIASVADLATSLSTHQRVAALLQGGALGRDEIAAQLSDVKSTTLRSAVHRALNRGLFVELAGNQIGLQERGQP